MPKDLARPRIGDAIRKVREEAGLNQTDLAAKLGTRQGAVSEWEREPLQLTEFLDRLTRIEEAVGAPKGRILRLAGYVEPETNVVGALGLDPDLEPEQRALLLDVYKAAVKRSGTRQRNGKKG